MNILNAAGGRYFDAVDITADQDGRWFNTDLASDLAFSFELQVGAGTITGLLFFEFTADPLGQIGISRLVLPAGSLLTNLSGVALAAGNVGVAVTAATSGSFSVHLPEPPIGKHRARWDVTAGTGGAPNLLQAAGQYRVQAR